MGGSILNVKSYQHGSENPYFKGDFQVDKHGDFELEMDIDKNALNNEPFIVEIGYIPETSDDVEALNIYGKEGEELKGPFIHKYTSIKRTRNRAFAYAYLELTTINASVKVVGFDITGVKSGTVVGPDGTFRFRIPRPDPEEIDNSDVMIKIEATSDGAIETEDIYGVNGKKFKGNLVKETKRGKKIEYKLHLGKDS